MLGLPFCVRAFSSCGDWGPLFIAVRGPLTVAASLVAEHRLQTRRLSSCGSRAQLLRGMWDLPRPGLKPVSPALAGRFSTTAPPGKPWEEVLTIVLKAFGMLVVYQIHTCIAWGCEPSSSHTSLCNILLEFPSLCGLFNTFWSSGSPFHGLLIRKPGL